MDNHAVFCLGEQGWGETDLVEIRIVTGEAEPCRMPGTSVEGDASNRSIQPSSIPGPAQWWWSERKMATTGLCGLSRVNWYNQRPITSHWRSVGTVPIFLNFGLSIWLLANPCPRRLSRENCLCDATQAVWIQSNPIWFNQCTWCFSASNGEGSQFTESWRGTRL